MASRADEQSRPIRVLHPRLAGRGVPWRRNAEKRDPSPASKRRPAQGLAGIRKTLLDAATGAVRDDWITIRVRRMRIAETCRSPDPGRSSPGSLRSSSCFAKASGPSCPKPKKPACPVSRNLAEAIEKMPWDQMQALFAAIYIEEIAAMQDGGGERLVREKLAGLSDVQRRAPPQGARRTRVRVTELVRPGRRRRPDRLRTSVVSYYTPIGGVVRAEPQFAQRAARCFSPAIWGVLGKRSALAGSGEGGYWVAAGVGGEGVGEVGEERLFAESAGDRGGEESFDGAFALFGLAAE